MSLNNTPSAERLHIGFFGMRNAGKSSLVNAVTGQNLSIVSEIKGTTTDPVKKAMELLPLGPVVIIDTPGLDDEGYLGSLRIQKTEQILNQINIGVLVTDSSVGLSEQDKNLIKTFEEKKIPYVIAYNKADLINERPFKSDKAIYVSAKTNENINELKEKIANVLNSQKQEEKQIVSDLLKKGDIVVMVIPIDESAPKGRLILPQQQTMRDILDAHCTFITCQPQELKETINSLNQKPALVITDSQAFEAVSKDTPQDIKLTSFSILFARYKGNLNILVNGAATLSKLKNGSKVLISEGCTHHRQCNDIGTVKMPAWIERFSGVKPQYSFTSGGEFPDNLKEYDLIIHCGGCMLNAQSMKSRMEKAAKSGVPIVNYGIAIAHMHGILKRSLEIFPDTLEILKKQA